MPMKKGHLCPLCLMMDSWLNLILSRVRQPIPPRSQGIPAILMREIAAL